MHADLILIILAALVVLAVVYCGLAWVYLPPRNLPGSGGARRQLASEAGMAVIPTAGADGFLYPLEMSPEAVPWAGESSSDDDWADQLHEINQQGYLRHLSMVTRGEMGDLTRPVAHLTHYEVEALIRTLAVPEWVPDRYRMAA